MRRLTGTAAVVVATGLALSAIVLVAALITDAVRSGSEGGDFQDRMSRIFGTDGVDDTYEAAMSEDEEEWDSEAWHEEIERLQDGAYTIPSVFIYPDDDGLETRCIIDTDAVVVESDLTRDPVLVPGNGERVIRISCPESVFFPGDSDDDGNKEWFLEDPADYDSDNDLRPFDDDSGRLPGLTEELLEILLDRFAEGDEDAFEFADEDDAWSEWDEEESYSGREFEQWSEGPFTFEYGGPDGGEAFTFRFYDSDGNESGGEPERFFFEEPWPGGPFTFSFRIPDDDHEYSFEMFDESWGKPDSWADDRFGFEEEWSKRPFSFRGWRDGGDDDGERGFPFGMFRDEWYSEEENGDYDYDESFGEFSEEFDDFFTEGDEYSFGEELSPEQEELMRQMMQSMMEMFGLEDLFPTDRFDFDDGDSDSDDYNGDGDDGAYSFHDSDSTTLPVRY